MIRSLHCWGAGSQPEHATMLEPVAEEAVPGEDAYLIVFQSPQGYARLVSLKVTAIQSLTAIGSSCRLEGERIGRDKLPELRFLSKDTLHDDLIGLETVE